MGSLWKIASGMLRVTFTLERDADSKRIRARTLLLLVAVSFALVGTVHVAAPMQLLANSPFNLDLALRTLSAGWFAPRDVIPVTLVEIDDATHRLWGSPVATPREPLVGLLQAVTHARPRAVVVDIDLAWGGAEADQLLLQNYLAAYQGPAPLIFPKRLEPAPGGGRRAAASPFDDVFATNTNLAWAHASFETDSGGVVRQWADWLEVCTPEGTTLLASIPARLSLMLEPLPPGLRRASAPPVQNSCQPARDPAGQLLLIGPRLTGPAASALSVDAAAVSAATILDAQIDRDDAWLFGDRVVLIGATHPASGDFWLTPSGVLPGVELLAHTVRLAPLRTAPGAGSAFRLRVAVLVAFLLFAAIGLVLRGLAMMAAYVTGGLLFVAVPIWFWEYYRVFEALEIAVLLVIVWKFCQALLDMIEDWKCERAKQVAGWRGRFATFWATCRRPASGGDADD